MPSLRRAVRRVIFAIRDSQIQNILRRSEPVKQITLRPHDVAVALQLVVTPQETLAAMGSALKLSGSEVHESVKRLRIAKLISASLTRQARRPSIEEFIEHGVRYAFPVQLGTAVRGIPTAHSGPLLRLHFSDDGGDQSVEDTLVWPHEDGTTRGMSVTPLYPGAPAIAKSNPGLYELLTLVDAFRMGKVRERRLAKALLTHALNVQYA